MSQKSLSGSYAQSQLAPSGALEQGLRMVLELGGLSFAFHLESERAYEDFVARFGPFVHRGSPEHRPALQIDVRCRPDPLRLVNWTQEHQPSPQAAMGLDIPASFLSKQWRDDAGGIRIEARGWDGRYDGDRSIELTIFTERVGHLSANFLSMFLPNFLYRHNRLLLHASGVLHEGKAHLFSGPSGHGKTTVVWHSPGREILSDELVIVEVLDDGVFAYGTPYFGTWGQLGQPLKAPVHCIHFLDKGPTHQILSLSGREQYRRLCQVICAYDSTPEMTEAYLAMASRLLGRCRLLSFFPDPSLWDFLSRPEVQLAGGLSL